VVEARPGLADSLRRSEEQRRGNREGRDTGGHAEERRAPAPRRRRAGAEDDETVVVSKAEWESVKEQLHTMVQQTEQLLQLLAKQNAANASSAGEGAPQQNAQLQ
jgi:hypothetical protein